MSFNDWTSRYLVSIHVGLYLDSTVFHKQTEPDDNKNTYVLFLYLVRASSTRLFMFKLTYGSGVPPPIFVPLIPRAEWTTTWMIPIAASSGLPESICSKFKLKILGSYIIGPRVPCVISRMKVESPGICGKGQQGGRILERRTHICDIKSERLTTDRFQNIVNDGLLQKANVHDLDMRKIRNQLHSNAQETAKRHILDEDR